MNSIKKLSRNPIVITLSSTLLLLYGMVCYYSPSTALHLLLNGFIASGWALFGMSLKREDYRGEGFVLGYKHGYIEGRQRRLQPSIHEDN